MQMLNRYFSPFALTLILSAIYFYEPESAGAPLPFNIKLSLIILAVSTLVNWWLSANTYRFIHWARQMRVLQVWLNFIWSAPLVYLLVPYWGPMWLLLVMSPVTAALYMSWWPTLGMSLISSATMLGIYYLQGMAPEGAALGMACVHALFIVIFSLFVHGLAQTALRLRDANLS